MHIIADIAISCLSLATIVVGCVQANRTVKDGIVQEAAQRRQQSVACEA